jgi:hypothetical protein
MSRDPPQRGARPLGPAVTGRGAGSAHADRVRLAAEAASLPLAQGWKPMGETA